MTYRATSGNLTTVPPGTSLATAGDDFLTDVRSILLADGQQSTVITAPIVDVGYHTLLVHILNDTTAIEILHRCNSAKSTK